MIYYGDEVATVNDYTFQNDKYKRDDNRWVHRPKLYWEAVGMRKKRGTTQNIIFSNLQRFLKVRRGSPEFADLNNRQIIDTGNQYLLAYLRYRDKLRTLVVCNFKEASQELDSGVLAGALLDINRKLVDKLTGTELVSVDRKIKLKPYQFFWITESP